MNHAHPTANLVLRALALLLIAVGIVVIFTSGWTSGLPPITVGVALLVVDLATRRRQGGPTRL
jgi:hypothetical protein